MLDSRLFTFRLFGTLRLFDIPALFDFSVFFHTFRPWHIFLVLFRCACVRSTCGLREVGWCKAPALEPRCVGHKSGACQQLQGLSKPRRALLLVEKTKGIIGTSAHRHISLEPLEGMLFINIWHKCWATRCHKNCLAVGSFKRDLLHVVESLKTARKLHRGEGLMAHRSSPALPLEKQDAGKLCSFHTLHEHPKTVLTSEASASGVCDCARQRRQDSTRNCHKWVPACVLYSCISSNNIFESVVACSSHQTMSTKKQHHCPVVCMHILDPRVLTWKVPLQSSMQAERAGGMQAGALSCKLMCGYRCGQEALLCMHFLIIRNNHRRC